MGGFFRRVFGQTSKCGLDAERNQFVHSIGDAEIFFIAAMQGDGIDPRGMTKEQLLAEIERAAQDLNERKSFEVFIMDVAGERHLPFFTSNDHASLFCGEYSKARDRVYPFQVLGVKGKFLATIDPASCDSIIMNPLSPEHRVLSQPELDAIRQIWR